MNPEQKKQILVGVLLLIAVGIVGYQFMPKSGGSNSSGGNTSTAALDIKYDINQVKKDLDTITDVDPLLSEIEVVTFNYDNEKTDRNPMAVVPLVIKAPGGVENEPAVQTEKLRAVYDMRVTGILWNEISPMAIVDNELVGVGKVYGPGISIVQIDRDRVWFDVEDARVPLAMKEL